MLCLVLCLCLLLALCQSSVFPDNDNFVTIRMNTFRRNELLIKSLSHYLTCSQVRQIVVVWSDQQLKPPLKELEKINIKDFYSDKSRVYFEMHKTDSLNNRFFELSPAQDDAILSVDDDVLVPCNDLNFALNVFRSNSDVLVGFSPRMVVSDTFSGKPKYLRWQHTWWNGFYSFALTKVALLHRKYLDIYMNEISEDFKKYIDKHRNCEDIAMAFIVSKYSRAPSVWVSGSLTEIGSQGISSDKTHFEARSECISILQNMQDMKPFVTGYQKATPFGQGVGWFFDYSDFSMLSNDWK